MEGRQLTLELFDRLEEAERLPEDMSVMTLLEQFDRTLGEIAGPEQLALAGEAIARLAGAFSERAELVLGDWEDRWFGPLVGADWTRGLEGRSATFDLAAYEGAEIKFPRLHRPDKKRERTRVRYVSKAEAIAETEAEVCDREAILGLAYSENVKAVEEAIVDALPLAGQMELLPLAARVAGGNIILTVLVVLLSDRLSLSISEDFYCCVSKLRVVLLSS